MYCHPSFDCIDCIFVLTVHMPDMAIYGYLTIYTVMLYYTVLCSVLLLLLFSISSSFGALLEHCWDVFSFQACADLFTFHLFHMQLYVHLLLCITIYMCPSVCILVHTYVYMCPYMFFHFLAFICCLI